MAKIQTINVQKTFNIGNYESLRLGGEFAIEDGETIEQATSSAYGAIAEMLKAYTTQAPAAAPAPTPQEEDKRTLVEANDDNYKRIVARINLGAYTDSNGKEWPFPTMESIEKTFRFTHSARQGVYLNLMKKALKDGRDDAPTLEQVDTLDIEDSSKQALRLMIQMKAY